MTAVKKDTGLTIYEIADKKIDSVHKKLLHYNDLKTSTYSRLLRDTEISVSHSKSKNETAKLEELKRYRNSSK
jgi:hypothetical protein